MIELTLKRLTGKYKEGPVLGVLFIENKLMFTTLEPPWLNNEKKRSCIPNDTYRCVINDSPKFGITYEVRGVPDRSGILFHIGNYSKDTEGCILLGSGFMPNEKGISDSEKAMSLFRQIVKSNSSAILTIKWT